MSNSTYRPITNITIEGFDSFAYSIWSDNAGNYLLHDEIQESVTVETGETLMTRLMEHINLAEKSEWAWFQTEEEKQTPVVKDESVSGNFGGVFTWKVGEASSLIDNMVYDEVTRLLTVRFHRGGTYVYTGVSLSAIDSVWEAARNNLSIGKAFNALIKGRHEVIKIL